MFKKNCNNAFRELNVFMKFNLKCENSVNFWNSLRGTDCIANFIVNATIKKHLYFAILTCQLAIENHSCIVL